jgi:hypothetical protein
VDFWDLTKLLVRRWWIALPMLLLSAGLAVLTFSLVKPDYVATAYVQLVPPAVAMPAPGQPTADQRNPWLGMGLRTIGDAARVTVLDKTVVDQLKANHYSDSYTVELDVSSPLATFQIVGDSRQQARETADFLVARYTRSIATLQASYGVSTADTIAARRLDQGTNIEKSTSKVKRALVAVAAAGILMTAGVTIGLDAWLRRRARRAGAKSPLPVPASGDALGQPIRLPASGSGAFQSRRVVPSRADADGPTTRISTNRFALSTNGAAAGDEVSTSLTIPIQPGRSQEPAAVEPNGRDSRPELDPDHLADATVVLPRMSLLAKENREEK